MRQAGNTVARNGAQGDSDCIAELPGDPHIGCLWIYLATEDGRLFSFAARRISRMP